MKKVLLVTCYCAYNYGAFLQASALQTVLKNKGFVVEFLRLNEELFQERNSNNYVDKCSQMFKIAQKQFPTKEFSVHDYDYIVLGSDEIWNLSNHILKKINVFWGIGLTAKRKIISYAPSIGNSTIFHFFLYPSRILALRNLDSISVRDDRTEYFASIFCKKSQNIKRVLDPTFLLSYEKYEGDTQARKPYIFCYTYGFSESIIKEIKLFAKIKGYRIIATGSKCEWADENPILFPEQWISYLKGADYVVTSTFHGTVFSIILNKSFTTFSEYSYKIDSLLKELGLEDRKSSDGKIVEKSIEYKYINPILRKKIDFSMQYLESELT